MILPVFGALSLAIATIMERVVLLKRNISVKLYQSGQFLAFIIVMIPIVPFFWDISNEAYLSKNILIFFLAVSVSMFANYFTFYSVKKEKIAELESAKITEPLWTIILAFIFSFIFGEVLYDRDPNSLIPGLIAGFALVVSNVKKHKIKFNKYYLMALLGSFCFGLDLVISRLILDYYNPIVFYFLRCLAIFILTVIIFHPKIKSKPDKKTILQILLTSFAWSAYMIIVYFGYKSLGVIQTTLAVMLGPIFVYFFAYKILKEKLTLRQVLTGAIVLACVLYSVIF